jgi:ribA/ribD-fused uncharacterized protein
MVSVLEECVQLDKLKNNICIFQILFKLNNIYKKEIKNKMDTCSYFIKNRSLFGSYPTQESVNELEEYGVRYFIDLTMEGETLIVPYKTEYTRINYPIHDRRVPIDWKSFTLFIINLSKIIIELKSHERVYIHCKGGHGRSGVVVACLLCYLGGFAPKNALELTTKYHNRRENMREKWRELGSPQTYGQKCFVYRFFEPLYFYRAYKSGYTMGMSNFSTHPVTTDLGTFPTSEAAFQAYKDPTNEEYVQKQMNSKTPVYSKHIGRRCNLRDDWIEKRDEIMKNVIMLKFEQNEDILINLMNTGLRPIIENSRMDSYWGCGENGVGHNKLGKILTSLRNNAHNKKVYI